MAAKVFEYADASIYGAGHIVSGHTIKHLMAAIGPWFLVVMLQKRTTAS